MEKTEDLIQQEIVIYLTNKYCLKHQEPRFLLFSVPNGGFRNEREGKKLRLTGLLPGTSDLVFQTDKEAIYIEVKTSSGKQSDSQKDFQKRIELLGLKYWLVKSLTDVIQLLQNKI